MTSASLDAAHKLQHNYEDTVLHLSPTIVETTKRIKQLSQRVDEYKVQRPQHKSQSDTSPENPPNLEFSIGELHLSTNAPQNNHTEPVYERLLNFGLNLKMKHDSKRKSAKHPSEEHHHKPAITKTALKLNRDGVHVEDLLLKRNVEYQAHKEDLRRMRDKEEMQSLHDPHINKVSQDLVRAEPAYSRLYDIRKQTLAKRELMRSKIREKEMMQVKPSPHINSVSKKMNRGVDAILEWEKERREKAERRKKELEHSEMAQCKPRRINRTSERLARRMNRGPKVEDHLLAEHERKKMEREEKLRLQHQKEAMEAVPLISLHSASLPRERDEKIFDRLYNSANRSHSKGANSHLSSSLNHSQTHNPPHTEQASHDRDPHTGQKLYHPSINERSSSMKRSLPVELLLQAKGEEKKRKREVLAKQLSQEMSEKKSSMGPYSQLLVEILEKRTKTSSQDRLHMPIKRRIKNVTKTELDSKKRAHTFQPQINPLSRAIDKNNNRGKRDRTALLFKKGKDYETKKDRLRQQIEAEKLSECTFSPRASSPGGRRRSSTPRGRRSSSISSIADRNNEWVRRRHQRLQEEREEKQRQMMEECTFQPNVHKRSSSTSRRMSTSSRSHTPPPKRSGRRDSYSGRSPRSRTPPPGASGTLGSERDGRISKFSSVHSRANSERKSSSNGYFHARDLLNGSVKNNDEEPARQVVPNPHAQPLGLREPSELPLKRAAHGKRNGRLAESKQEAYNIEDYQHEAETDERESVRREQERARLASEAADKSQDDVFGDITIDMSSVKFSSEASALLKDLLEDFSI